MNLDEVRVAQLAGDAIFAEEAAPLFGGLRLEGLERNDAMGAEVRGLPHDAHAAFAELLHEPELPADDRARLHHGTVAGDQPRLP